MKLEIPDVKKLVHEMVMPIRWGDMDAMGHLNNASYMRFMETIRIEWFTRIGCDPNPQGQGPVIVNVFCNFYKQLSGPKIGPLARLDARAHQLKLGLYLALG